MAEELRFSQRAEAAARQAADAGLLARVLDIGEFEDAERVSREAVSWAEASGVASDALLAVYTLAELRWRRGAHDQAAERGRRSVDFLLGMVALGRRDLVAAHDHTSWWRCAPG